MNQKGFISNIVIIIVILGIAFFSQQAGSERYGNMVKSQAEHYWALANDFVKNNITSRLTPEVEKGKAQLEAKIETEKNNLNKSIWEKIKNYFAGIFSKFSGTQVE